MKIMVRRISIVVLMAFFCLLFANPPAEAQLGAFPTDDHPVAKLLSGCQSGEQF